MVIICRQTGYVLAIPCREKGLDNKSAASEVLDRCVQMFRLPKEFICDNASIENCEFLRICLPGVELINTAPWPTNHRATDVLNEYSKLT